MRWCLSALLLLVLAGPAHAADALTEARRLYNLGQYEMAEGECWTCGLPLVLFP